MPRICIGAKAKFRGVKFYDNLKDKFCGELRSTTTKFKEFRKRNLGDEITWQAIKFVAKKDKIS